MTLETEDAEARLASLREAVLTDWVSATTHLDDVLDAIQDTLSWRITNPLRVFSRGSRQPLKTVQLSAVATARTLGDTP